MTESTDDVSLVVLRVCEENIASIVAGSVQHECSQCGHKVWVAKAGQNVLATHTGVVNIMCMECAQPLLQEPDTKMSIAPGALEEMRNHLRGNP